MGKSRAMKTFKFIIFLLVVCLLVFGFYYLFSGERNPFSDIIDNFTEEKMLDNYNGIYHYKDQLEESYNFFAGCTINYISDYIFVAGDKYYVYRSSCLGTYPKDRGDVERLDFRINEETKKYYIRYNSKDFVKDDTVYKIEPLKKPLSGFDGINLTSFSLLVQETQLPGFYSGFDVGIANLSAPISMQFRPNETGTIFTLSFSSSREVIFQRIITDLDYLPKMYPYGSWIVYIEKAAIKENEKNLQNDNFLVIGSKGIVYDLEHKFPIIVDDVVLNSQNSTYIMFDKKAQIFRVLIGYDDKFCVEDGTTDDIVAYEFTIDYNYLTDNFEDPVFVQKIYAKDQCTYVNNLMEG